MSSSVVTIRVNGQPYQLGCDPGQEAQIEALGKIVDDTVGSLLSSVGQIGETRLLVMAAILLAEKASAAPDAGEKGITPSADTLSDEDVIRLENIAKQLSTLADKVK